MGDGNSWEISSRLGTMLDGFAYITRELAAILQRAGFYAHLEKLKPREDVVVSLHDSPQCPSLPGVPLLPHELGPTYVTKRMLWKCQWVSSEVLKCMAASTLLSEVSSLGASQWPCHADTAQPSGEADVMSNCGLLPVGPTDSPTWK